MTDPGPAPQNFMQEALPQGKPPQLVFPGLFAFPPNRETLGGSAYWIETQAGNALVDCPPWTEATQEFLRDRPSESAVRWLFLTQRNAIASINRVKQIQQALDCEVVIQEQEAYLIPGSTVTTFHREMSLAEGLTAIWTPGFSPGSACLYWRIQGEERQKDEENHRGVLFTGRHLLPTRSGRCEPLRSSKTFHWPRQLRSVEQLRDRFSPETLQYLCPGASIGFLRGQHLVEDAYQQLAAIDLNALKMSKPGL